MATSGATDIGSRTTEPTKKPTRPLRIGIWSTYEGPVKRGTMMPDEGIGVFIHNLVRGLSNLPNKPDIAILSYQEGVAGLKKFYGPLANKLEFIVPSLPRMISRFDDVINRWVSYSDRIASKRAKLEVRSWEQRHRIRTYVYDRIVQPILGGIKRKRPLALLAAVTLIPIVGLLGWLIYAGYKLTSALGSIATAPVRWLDTVVRNLHGRPKPQPVDLDTFVWAAVDQAQCDIWVIPSLHSNFPPGLPSILFVHDLVTSHFPEFFPADFLEQVNRLVPQRAEQATVVACMSAFIRDNDLKGVLGLPEERVRMVRSATPDDMPKLSDAEADRIRPIKPKRPYLFFPTVFRPHKNIATLIRALGTLRDEHGIDEFDLVLTHFHKDFLMPEYKDWIAVLKLQGRVHVVGRASREELAALYKGAFATIVPSLYEQGSYQISESLLCGTPVACSNIQPFTEQCASMGDAMLYFEPLDPKSIADAIIKIRDNRAEITLKQLAAFEETKKRTWEVCAAEWMEVFEDSAALGRRQLYLGANNTSVSSPRPLEVFLFLQIYYLGGVWEATKNLVNSLIEINRQRRQLTLSFGVAHDQKDVESLHPSARPDRLPLSMLNRQGAINLVGMNHPAIWDDRSTWETYFWPNSPAALRADAWFSLVDRFPVPLLGARPYGVLVYDMIQFHVPEVFTKDFFDWQRRGISTTIRHSDMVMTTNPVTKEEAMREYKLDSQKMRLVPVSCEPHLRFDHLTPEPIALPNSNYILNVTNSARHKGAAPVIKAYARLKKQLGDAAPMFVMCGGHTNHFSKSYVGAPDPHWDAIRKLVGELGLEEGKDLVFLGYVNDSQLRFLFENCLSVVNSAKYDNGTFSLIEAKYFGRPVISTRYPAAEALYQRFGIPVRYFPVDDDEVLAQQMLESLRDPIAIGPELAMIRKNLRDPEYSFRRYAERVYDMLIELAIKGRQQRVHGYPSVDLNQVRRAA